MVICLEQGADLVPAHTGSPGHRAVKRVCVCVRVVYQVVVVCCGFVERELVACALLWRVAVTCARLTSQAVNTSATHSGTAVNVTCDVIAPVPRSPLAFRTRFFISLAIIRRDRHWV